MSRRRSLDEAGMQEPERWNVRQHTYRRVTQRLSRLKSE